MMGRADLERARATKSVRRLKSVGRFAANMQQRKFAARRDSDIRRAGLALVNDTWRTFRTAFEGDYLKPWCSQFQRD